MLLATSCGSCAAPRRTASSLSSIASKMEPPSVDTSEPPCPKRARLEEPAAPRDACAAVDADARVCAPQNCDEQPDAAPAPADETPQVHNRFETPDLMQYDDSNQDGTELEPDDDNSSTVSGLSDMSGREWKPMMRSMAWVQKQMNNGVDPRVVLGELDVTLAAEIPHFLDDITLWKIIANILSEPPQRQKLRHVNSLDDVVRLLKESKNVIVLTGAGVSVSCGIPDFRSRDGIYLRLSVDFPDLPDPQAMFDIGYFNQDPRPFYKFARDIYPGNFQPSPCHNFIRLLERRGRLLRNYTQNIDTLEKVAGINRVVECHGSFATATCTKCGHKVTAETIREPVLAQKIPLCPVCHTDGRNAVSPDEIGGSKELSSLVNSGIVKPDIVFFGEGLPDSFHESITEDKSKCDLLVVIGSSLKVKPVAFIPNSLPSHVPQILINREPLTHCHFDVELLGDCDVIVNHLCQMMGEGWDEGVHSSVRLRETLHLVAEEQEQSPPSPPITYAAEVNLNFFKSVKTRHESVDSARDSGIGDNSNLTIEPDETNGTPGAPPEEEEEDEQQEDEDHRATIRLSPSPPPQQRIRRNVADRLPPDSYYVVPPSRYVFPGAEIYYDPHESYHRTYFDDVSTTTSGDSSDSESEEPDNDNNLL